MTLLKVACTEGEVGVQREIGLQASSIIAIKETFNWMCCNLNEEGWERLHE